MDRNITKEEINELQKIGFDDYMIDLSNISKEDYELLIKEIKRINILRGRNG